MNIIDFYMHLILGVIEERWSKMLRKAKLPHSLFIIKFTEIVYKRNKYEKFQIAVLDRHNLDYVKYGCRFLQGDYITARSCYRQS
jgi:hypothetical protein